MSNMQRSKGSLGLKNRKKKRLSRMLILHASRMETTLNSGALWTMISIVRSKKIGKSDVRQLGMY